MESLKGYDRKIFGTPLVMCLEEESLTGADIAMSVSQIMTPLRRSPVAIMEEDNGFSKDFDEPSDSSGDKQENNSDEMMDSDGEDLSTKQLPFQLSLIEDNRANDTKPIHWGSVVRCGQVLKIMLDWTDKEHELYDTSYFKDLPEVNKSGFTAKKTRQEAISLFSCLDAFLKEEPLGPDDMWYALGTLSSFYIHRCLYLTWILFIGNVLCKTRDTTHAMRVYV